MLNPWQRASRSAYFSVMVCSYFKPQRLHLPCIYRALLNSFSNFYECRDYVLVTPETNVISYYFTGL